MTPVSCTHVRKAPLVAVSRVHEQHEVQHTRHAVLYLPAQLALQLEGLTRR